MSKSFQLARRGFLNLAAALGLSTGLRAMGISAPPARRYLAPDEFKRRLRGPIVSIPTPFTADLIVDHEAVRRMIRRALDYGINVFCLTARDSQFFFLSYEEVKELVRVVAETVGDWAMTIAGSGAWWTERAVEFARHAQSVGATAVMVLLPSGGDEDSLVTHYQQVARSMGLPIVLHGNYPIRLLERLTKIDSIVALKEDVTEQDYVETQIHFGQRLNCFSGGSYEYFVVGQPYGSLAYFDTYSTFAPEISARFWKAVQANDYATERAIIEKYDHPLIYHEFSHPVWHATLQYFGVAKRYLRPPQHTYTDEESIVTEPKTRKSKAPIPVIAPLAEKQNGHRFRLGNPEKGCVFRSSTGTPVNLANLASHDIKPVLVKAGLQWRGWHAFRGGLATNLNRLGIAGKTIQAILRHADLSTTMNSDVKCVSADSVAAMLSFERRCTQNAPNCKAN